MFLQGIRAVVILAPQIIRLEVTQTSFVTLSKANSKVCLFDVKKRGIYLRFERST